MKWISIKEAYPPDGNCVLIAYFNHTKIKWSTYGIYTGNGKEGGKWIDLISSKVLKPPKSQVIAWCMLPSPEDAME